MVDASELLGSDVFGSWGVSSLQERQLVSGGRLQLRAGLCAEEGGRACPWLVVSAPGGRAEARVLVSSLGHQRKGRQLGRQGGETGPGGGASGQQCLGLGGICTSRESCARPPRQPPATGSHIHPLPAKKQRAVSSRRTFISTASNKILMILMVF